MKETREEKEAWGEVDKLRGEVMMMQREWRVSRGPGREGQPGIPPGLQKLLDKCRELGGGEGEWREELELWRWFVALLKATRADGSMASRAWARVIVTDQLPVSPPDWLLERAVGHKVTAKPVKKEQVIKDVEEVIVKAGNSVKPQNEDVKETEVKELNSENPQGDVKEVEVKEEDSEKQQGDGFKEVEVKKEDSEKPQIEDVKDEEEEDVKVYIEKISEEDSGKPQSEEGKEEEEDVWEEVYIEKISEEDSEKPQSEEGKEEEEDVWEEIDIKEEKVNEEDSEKPQSEEDKEKEEDMWEEVDIMEVKEVSEKPQSEDEETPRKRGKCSPGAAARSRRRLLEFQARIEPVLGPSRLQLLQRGLTTPSSPIPRKHQTRATNPQVMFEAAAKVERTASTAGAEEASSTAAAGVAARAEGVPGGGRVVEEVRGEGGSSGGSAGYINLHGPSTTPYGATTPYPSIPPHSPFFSPFIPAPSATYTPYSPTNQTPYSPTNHTPYSPTNYTPYPPSTIVPYSPTIFTPFFPPICSLFSPLLPALLPVMLWGVFTPAA